MNKKFFTIFLSLILISFFSCKKKNDETPEPTTASPVVNNVFYCLPDSVDFTVEDVTFHADFIENINWTITLQGLTSQALKELRGNSQNLSETRWRGNPDNLFFFQEGEKVVARLKGEGYSNEYFDTIYIKKKRSYSGLVITDFEGSLTGILSYTDDPANTSWQFKYASAGFSPAEGNRSYGLYGQDINNDYFVGGMVKYFNTTMRASLPSDPDSLYLNFYVYGTGNDTSLFIVGLREDDNNGTSGVYEPATDDEFQCQILLSHTGWKLVSVKYSDMFASISPINGGSGNHLHEPGRITDFAVSLISSYPGKTVEVIYDYPVLTFGSPLTGY